MHSKTNSSANGSVARGGGASGSLRTNESDSYARKNERLRPYSAFKAALQLLLILYQLLGNASLSFFIDSHRSHRIDRFLAANSTRSKRVRFAETALQFRKYGFFYFTA